MIVKVVGVNMASKTISAVEQGPNGTRPLPDVKLTHKCSPAVGDHVLVLSDAGEFYAIDTLDSETIASVENSEENQLVPGDEVLGDVNGTGMVVRRGGLLTILADKVTGIVMSKINGMLQFFGKRISMDTTFFHGKIRTHDDDRNSSLELSLFGSPDGSPISTELIKAAIDTMQAKVDLDVAGVKDINLNLNIAPQTGIVTGTNFNFNLATPQGVAIVKVNGTTGVVEVSSPTVLKLDAPYVFINSDGSPLDRVLTAKTISPATGNIIGQGSGRVFVGL